MVGIMDEETVQLLENIKSVAEKHPGRLFDVLNSLNINQYRSKKWLLEKLNQYPYHFKNKTKDSIDIAVLGGWYGFMANLLQKEFLIKPIREVHSYDYDPLCKKIGEIFFPTVKFVERRIEDVEFQNKSYSVVVNTSCEHMEQSIIDEIIARANENTLFVLQSNNYIEVDEHINCSISLTEFAERYENKLKNCETYELNMDKYTRFMLIGTKQ
jgi:hypothetical protein